MRKLFLFALSAMMIGGCSEEVKTTVRGIEFYATDGRWPNYPINELTFDFAGGEQTILVIFTQILTVDDRDPEWRLTGGESWCTPSVTRGMEGDKITFTVTPFTESSARKATFICQSRGAQAQFYITQTGHNAIHIEKAGTLGDVLSNMNKGEIRALTITGHLNDVDFLTIRNKLYGLEYLDISEIPLTTLPANSFSSMSIKKVILPKNLQVIPQSLFKNCELLEEVTIPSGVTEIKGGYEENKCFGAFYNCKALKSINIPAGIEVLESGTFAYCKNLETVTFAKNSKLNTIADGGSYTDWSSSPSKNYYYGVFSCCTSTNRSFRGRQSCIITAC